MHHHVYLKVKGSDIFYKPLLLLTGKPEQQRLIIRSGVLASTSGRPLPSVEIEINS